MIWTVGGEEARDGGKTVAVAFAGGNENNVFVGGFCRGGIIAGRESFDVPGNAIRGFNALWRHCGYCSAKCAGRCEGGVWTNQGNLIVLGADGGLSENTCRIDAAKGHE